MSNKKNLFQALCLTSLFITPLKLSFLLPCPKNTFVYRLLEFITAFTSALLSHGNQRLRFFLPSFENWTKNRTQLGFFSCLSYRCSDEPEVYIVVFAQTGAVDLQALTGEK